MNQSKTHTKEKYRQFCEERDDIPLFLHAWWMDAVCIGKEWDVLLYEKNDRIVGIFVYHYIVKFGLKFVIQPQLTQYNGIWIEYPDNLSNYKKLSLEKEVMTSFIEQLDTEKISYFELNFAPYITNWLPFYWKGFSQSTRYTYQVKDISNPEKCFEKFEYAKKKQINKSIDNLIVEKDLASSSFYNLVEEYLDKNGEKVFYSREIFESLYNACKKREQCTIIAVKNEYKQYHAMLFVVWDKHNAYALISAIDPDYRSSGASTLMFWEAIKYLSDKCNVFDFEGSMIEGVENSFRQFGTKQVPYFNIRKSNSSIARFILSLKNGKNR